MQGQAWLTGRRGEFEFHRHLLFRIALAGFAGAMMFGSQTVGAQSGQTTGSELRLGIAEIPTPLSKLPDANVQMTLQARKRALHRFDAANALRQKQMVEEATRLLQLARDLQARVMQLGDGPLNDRLVQEAGAIEMLAHDVQARMVLTVGNE